MRIDPQPFATYNWARGRKPYYVAQIIFDVSSPSFTSSPDITGVPGTILSTVIQSISSISQEVRPEEGRTTIGSITLEVQETETEGITAELREQLLTYDQGPRDKELRIYVGYTTTFAQFVRVATMYVDHIGYENGKYRIQARDKTRELRKRLFEVKSTVLIAALAADATVIEVDNTTAFAMIPHGASFQDAPNATVGYVRVRDTGEIIRYTGKTASTLTGCTRAVFGTRAAAVAFNPVDSRDNWPVIEEIVYLELPGPLAAIALMTGVMDPAIGTVALPTHWHLGMDWSADFDQAAWLSLGEDLYDPDDISAGFPVRFLAIDNEDGKAFLEREIFQLCGIYAAAKLDGSLTVRRINRVLPDSGYVARLNTTNIIKAAALEHDYRSLLNVFRVDYNWDGEDYTRSVAVVDSQSLLRHGPGDERVLKFKGLHTARHTERAIRERLGVLRDRYGEPPLRQPLTVAGYLNGIELGDVVFIDLPGTQDYTRAGASLQRSFEVQRTSINWITGEVQLECFASARLVQSQPENDDTTPPIADAFYTAIGTNMASLAGYVAATGGTPARLSQNLTLTGNADDLRSAVSVWYHDDDLTIDSGVTITIGNQAQLRVRGFLQINGVVNGAALGFAGATEPDALASISSGWTRAGTGGYLGPSRGGDGLWIINYDQQDWDDVANIEGPLTAGANGNVAAGPLALDVTPTGISGFPARLQGSSGGRGGQVVFGGAVPGGGIVRGRGGAGGASGAGLLIICRGLGFGPSGYIDLSGADGAAGEKHSTFYDFTNIDGKLLLDWRVQAGAGAGGYPGTLYVLLDGDGVPYPDINSTTYRANRGNTPLQGVSALDIHPPRKPTGYPYPRWSKDLPQFGNLSSPLTYLCGRNEAWQGAGSNIWTVAHCVQYVPALPVAQEQPIPPPAGLIANTGLGFVSLAWNWPIATAVDYVEVFASLSQDRAFAEEIAAVRGGGWNHNLTQGGVRYYWVRARGYDGRASAWYPISATAGVQGSAADSGMEWVLSSTVTRAWTGDGTTSPHTWTPPDAYTDLSAELLQFGQVIASERLRVTRDAVGMLTWAYLNDDPTITTTASPSPATSLRFGFVHPQTGMEAADEIIAVFSGEGPAGPPGSRITSIRANRNSFSGTSDGWMYIHGFDDLGNPVDGPGEINFAGAPVAIAAGSIATTQNLADDGWLIFETAGGNPFNHAGSQKNVAAARKTRAGWRYDATGGWTSFTATATMVVIGTYSRAGGVITTAALLGNAMALGAVPYELAHTVQPGDITAGAVNDLANFASTLRPVTIVSSLPSLPSSAYPTGALVYLTSNNKVYRNSAGTWTLAVDGADITAGTITAAALAADLVLGTLIRTADTGVRVEMQGGGHAFPLWLGSGTKGSASGSPGSGAMVYYDRVANTFNVKGRLIASRLQADTDNVLDVVTSSGFSASVLSAVNFDGLLTIALGATWTTIATVASLYHPGNSSGGLPQYRRLQDVQQPFIVDLLASTINVLSVSGTTTVEIKMQYSYDGDTWADFFAPNYPIVVISQSGDGSSRGDRWIRYLKPRNTWSASLQLRLQAREISPPDPPDQVTVLISGMLVVPNLGAQGITATQIG